ncbi:MAG: hypothetical protein ABI723_13360 [Bacteroidia bacterium]
MKKIILILSLGCIAISTTDAQVTSNKLVGEKRKDEIDSLKKVEYPYIFPIWGQKVVQKGFDLPYSAGFSAQYLWQQSDLTINNLQVGFNNNEMYNLDQIIRFNSAVASTSGINIRPDFWLLPFLNVYGILAQSKTSTAVDFGIWIPQNDSTWSEAISTNTKANFDATTFGFGLTPTVGVGGFWMAFDLNCTWTDVSALDKPAFGFVFGPRFGKNFRFKKPERSVALWAGGFRVKIGSETNGSLPIGDLFATEEWKTKIDNGYTAVENGQQQVDAWWNSLTPPQQNNPINKNKYEVANNALQLASNVLNGASGAVSTVENSTVQYSLEKKQKQMWNFIVGAQFQLNKHWMVRSEYGFLGTRQQFIGGLQYRFGL